MNTYKGRLRVETDWFLMQIEDKIETLNVQLKEQIMRHSKIFVCKSRSAPMGEYEKMDNKPERFNL